jgi:hypothetical protein
MREPWCQAKSQHDQGFVRGAGTIFLTPELQFRLVPYAGTSLILQSMI